jgi:phosphatidate cytidylyltransferase
MADSNKAFIQRVISGLLAALILLGLAVYGGTNGLHLAITFMTVLGIREYSRIAFRHWQMPPLIEPTYWALCVAMFVALFFYFNQALEIFVVTNVAFLIVALWMARARVSNENLLPALALGSFGLMYCVLFPFLAARLVLLPEGGYWFLFLLLVVFFGDTFAYFGGRWLGRHKMSPQISPNKTWEGAASGLLGSCLAGLVELLTVFQDIPWYHGLLFCLVCGAASQSGDLLVSLIKRVAQVKDSGHLMPGHGGVLDRLDGVYIACPLVYSFALYVTTHQVV